MMEPDVCAGFCRSGSGLRTCQTDPELPFPNGLATAGERHKAAVDAMRSVRPRSDRSALSSVAGRGDGATPDRHVGTAED
jgi:hypothetical protein